VFAGNDQKEKTKTKCGKKHHTGPISEPKGLPMNRKKAFPSCKKGEKHCSVETEGRPSKGSPCKEGEKISRPNLLRNFSERTKANIGMNCSVTNEGLTKRKIRKGKRVFFVSPKE